MSSIVCVHVPMTTHDCDDEIISVVKTHCDTFKFIKSFAKHVITLHLQFSDTSDETIHKIIGILNTRFHVVCKIVSTTHCNQTYSY